MSSSTAAETTSVRRPGRVRNGSPATRQRIAGEPFLTRPGRLTEVVSAAVEEELGARPELSTSGGTSDGRFIAPYGIDVVELGPLNATIHKVDECVSIADLERLERMYFRIAERLLIG